MLKLLLLKLKVVGYIKTQITYRYMKHLCKYSVCSSHMNLRLHGSAVCCADTPDSAVGHFQTLLLQLLREWKVYLHTELPELCLTQMLEAGRGNLHTLISQPAHTNNAYSASSPRLMRVSRLQCTVSVIGEQHRHQNLLYWHIFPWKSGSTMSWGYEGFWTPASVHLGFCKVTERQRGGLNFT